jgi:uncharacterized protein YegP (UPF0339 family)
VTDPTPAPPRATITVYQDDAGEWRWRIVDVQSGKILGDSGEGYANKGHAAAMATRVSLGGMDLQIP